MLSKIQPWLRSNWRLIVRTSTIFGTLAAAIWAVISLLYPTQILPRLEPGRIDVQLTTEEISRDKERSVHRLTVTYKNSGMNRLYIPALYLLVRANKALANFPSQYRSAEVADPTPSIPEQQRQERNTIEFTQLLNAEFTRSWNDQFIKDSFARNFSIRSGYSMDDALAAYLQLNRISGKTDFLEPGDSNSYSTIVFVPAPFNVIVVDAHGIASKEDHSKWVFVGTPYAEGLSVLPIERASLKDADRSNFKAMLETSIKTGAFSNLSQKMYPAFAFHSRHEAYIGLVQNSESKPSRPSSKTSAR